MKHVINIGIIGLGRLGKVHADNLVFSVPNVNLIAACSLIPEELNYAKENLGVTRLYNEYAEMLNDDDIDAIVIVSPSHLHCQQVIQAFEAGKHVFVEKPLGISLDEMKEVKKVVEKRPEQVFMLGFMRRFDPSYLYAKEMIDRGEIGEVSLIRCYGIDPHAGMESFIEFAKKSKSGGLFLDMAIHDIDLIRWYTGSEIKKVWALGNNIAYPILDELGDLETGAALCELDDKKIGIIVSGRNSAHGYHVETEIIGTKGSVRVANIQEKNLVTVLNENGTIRPTSQNFPERFKEAFINEMKAFIQCIREGVPSTITPDDGIYSTMAALACGDSLEKGTIIEVK